ncbi:MAG TPA: endonuclease/exonuclease/phosphatase family protein, partial [Calditrichia bacterium]|nr:endonuclease/exonuclease/phosphatase family protein [Calditrichia bacterium]
RSTDISANKRWEPRTVMRTDLDLGEGRRMHLFNVHLGLRTRERFRQQRMLLSRAILFDKGLHNPIAIMGDFNDRPLPVVHPQFRRHFRDAYHLAGTGRRSTFRFGPVKYSLDYIYVNRDLRPIRTFIVRDPLAQMASDHLPIVSDVRVTFSEKSESNPLPVSRRLGLKKFSPRRFLRESQLRNKKEGDRS